MKTKIRILLALLVTAISTNLAIAQKHGRQRGPQPPVQNKEQMKKMLDHLSQELVLDNEQTKQLSELFNTHFDEVQKEMEKAQKVRESHLQKMESLRKDFEEKVNRELSEEQQKLFAEFRENHQPPRRNKEDKPRKK